MTSLAPGVLFKTPGFNRTSTPVELTDTPTDVYEKHAIAGPITGDWPSDSPVAKVYDIQNSTSRMILLNNKSSKTHLRGQTPTSTTPRHETTSSGNNGSSSSSSVNEYPYSAPDPLRHYFSPTPERERHIECVKSETPRFEARPHVPLSRAWANVHSRPPVTFRNGSHVNEWHHYACQVSTNPVYQSLEYQKNHRVRPKTLPPSFRGSHTLEHPELSNGQKKYLADTAHVYSVSKMKQLVQTRYEHLVYKQKVLGFFGQDDYQKYLNYIQGPKKRLFGSKSSISGGRHRPKTADARLQSENNTTQDSRSREATESGDYRPKTSLGNKQQMSKTTPRQQPQSDVLGERQQQPTKPKTPQSDASQSRKVSVKDDKQSSTEGSDDKENKPEVEPTANLKPTDSIIVSTNGVKQPRSEVTEATPARRHKKKRQSEEKVKTKLSNMTPKATPITTSEDRVESQGHDTDNENEADHNAKDVDTIEY